MIELARRISWRAGESAIPDRKGRKAQINDSTKNKGSNTIPEAQGHLAKNSK
jgi:hypothetical protein